MNEAQAENPAATPGTSQPISIQTEHGTLRGTLQLPPRAGCLIVLAHAGRTPDAHDEALAHMLQQTGMGTLVIDLLTHQEEHFADVHNNVPLLAKRLLECLTLIKHQMQNEELPTLPVGLCAADSASPVIIRVAALRDHDIAAVACRGGLIDLAGALYLRSLISPLLVLVGENDGTLVSSSQRALREVACPKTLRIIPATGNTFTSADAFGSAAGEIANWFARYCLPTTH